MAGIVHGGGLTAACARYGGAPADWLDLSTGINPNPVGLPDIPPAIWNRLPDQGLMDAARHAALRWYLSTDVGQPALPLPVPGTQAFIQILPRLVPAGRPVAVLSPTYGEYAHCFRRAGFQVDEIQSLEMLRPDHGTVIIVNPNNPDGRIFARVELEALVTRMAAQGGHVHVDEAFGDMRPVLSMAALAVRVPHLTVSRSFGKIFGMAGARLGFVFAVEPILEVIERELGPWAVSGPALYLSTQLMQRDRQGIAAALTERRGALQVVLESAGFHVIGGTELFALVRHKKASTIFKDLARAYILVRRFDYAAEWLRIGLAPDERGDARLAAALASMEF